jgi:hypothetical protein
MHHVLASYKHMLQCQQQTASHVQVSSCMGPADLAIGQLFKERACPVALWMSHTAASLLAANQPRIPQYVWTGCGLCHND